VPNVPAAAGDELPNHWSSLNNDGGFAFIEISISVFQLQTILEDLQIQDRYVLQIQ
jgi:hypothetical protein